MLILNFPTFCKVRYAYASDGKWDLEREYPVLETDSRGETVLLPDEDGRLRWVLSSSVLVVRVVYPPDVYQRLETLELETIGLKRTIGSLVKALEAVGLLNIQKDGEETGKIIVARPGDVETDRRLREGERK